MLQCLRVSARDVVEDMKLYMSGKSLSGRAVRGNHIPPPPEEPAPAPPVVNGYRDYCKYNLFLGFFNDLLL